MLEKIFGEIWKRKKNGGREEENIKKERKRGKRGKGKRKEKRREEKRGRKEKKKKKRGKEEFNLKMQASFVNLVA